MLFGLGTPEHPPGPETRGFHPRPAHWLIAAAVSLTVLVAGMLVVNLQAREIEARRRVELLGLGSSVRARLSRELNRVLYLTSGLSSYLAVRHNDLQRGEIEAILAALHHESRHIRNFAIAVGYTVTYIYPVKGNEKAVGLYYPDVPDQWPAVKRAADTGAPVLTGPLNLVQGGSGLVYRVPIFIHGVYWGILSSVIDADSLLRGALTNGLSNGYALAIRGKDGAGMQGDVFWGDAALFGSRNAQLIDVDVPGGKWVIALRATMASPEQHSLSLMRGLVCVLALTLGWSALVVLVQRMRLGQLALFDALTGLPNRLLIEDRIERAMSSLRRDPSRTCLLLFIDLDGFKLVNDRLGHKAGDTALQNTAQRIIGAVRETDTVGRWGGDEFIVFMENVEQSKVGELTAKIRQVVELPTTYGQQQFTVGASIGSVLAPDDGMTLDDLVRTADERMYADKTARNTAR